ncbi:hypothetical protein BN1723_013890, partial [Verticillium longisporum]|uniref:Uncharacterized protein n=1 Tax=Verticillium longisporum TaxID=100787 RepID=A0A0G4MLY7_VERLO
MPTALPSRVSRVHLSSTTPTTMHDGGRQGRVGFLEWTRWARYQEAKTVVILIHRERSGSITSLHLARSPRAQAHEPGAGRSVAEVKVSPQEVPIMPSTRSQQPSPAESRTVHF